MFPTRTDCVKYLEQVRWNGYPECPYCGISKCTNLKSEDRYYCLNCNSSFSVTVGTIFHNTRLELQKWFIVINVLISENFNISGRKLSRVANINKDTACRIKQVISEAVYNTEQRILIFKIHDRINI